MSETILIDEPKASQSYVVVDLGTASEQTRGTNKPFFLFDGNTDWPFLFVYS